MAADCEHITLRNLSDVGKYSYASLCSIILSNLFETSLDRKWSEEVIIKLVKHLYLPQQVLTSLLQVFQMGNCEDHPSERIIDSLQTAPLIAVLKKESSVPENSLVGYPKELLNLVQELGEYDARLRVLMFSLGDQLIVGHSELENSENVLVERLKQLKDFKTCEDPELQKKEVKKKRKKAVVIALGALGGGALIGLTGGLAAPLIAAGAGAVLGASSAAVLSTTAGLAFIASIFGAAGAGLTGYRLRRRIGQIEEFEFEQLGKGEQLHLAIAVSGWVPDDTQDLKTAFKIPWRDLNVSQEQYSLTWESRYLAEMGSAMSSFFAANSIGYVTQEALKYTVLSGLVSAISWPLFILQLGYAIDNPWHVCSRRAAEVGEHLADILLSRQQGKRPVTLIGFSLGARVIFFCLEALAKKCGVGIIENAILLGAPVTAELSRWACVGQVVAGKLINGYCCKDWFLKFVYRTASAQLSVAGLQEIKWKNRRMINVDLSELIDGHLDYSNADKLRTVLEILGISTRSHERIETERMSQESSCTVNKTISTNDEATTVVLEILEERIDVAIEVSTLIHQTAANEPTDQGQIT